jgi:integrase
MPIEKLTASKVARISMPGKYGDGNGLYLYVTKALVKSWVFRYQLNNREHYKGLGPLYAVSIHEAREEARKARACLARRKPPFQDHTVDVAGKRMPDGYNKTFDECVIEYIALHKHEWQSLKHLKQWESSLCTYASPHFGKALVRKITTALVLQALNQIWTTKTETASRLRERIERVLSWAIVCGYRKGDNPARWDGHLQELLPNPSRLKKIRHYPAMPYQEIGEFFRILGTQQSIKARALEFTILTACRTAESLHARWDEIDFARRLWVIPGERMKSGREHKVPLSDPALSVLSQLKGGHPEWVFPGAIKEKPLYGGAMRNVLKNVNRGDVTVHGFRSSFRTWAAEQTTFPKELAELALAHKAGTQVEEAYQRSTLFERRRALMQCWADWCGCPCHLSSRSRPGGAFDKNLPPATN